MAKALNVSLAVTADTSQAKAQLQQLQQSLQQLTSSSTNLQLGINSADIQKASAAALELSAHLKQATNINTGTLDFAKLNNSLIANKKSLSDYGDALLKLGPQGQQAFQQLAQSIAQSEVPTKRLTSLFGEFGTVLKNTIRWQLSSSAIHGFMGAVSTAYHYAQDLNKSLNNIQIVTGASDAKMAKFAESANKAAKALSTSTTAYTDASLIYYQQGLSDKEVAARAETTIKMANITGQSAQKVSDQMTAIWNNFAKGSTNLEYYADVITALGAATASSSEEISTGLEKFAAIADTVGLSYENASAALATITATTRQSADTVGTGLRTLFSRLQSVSLGETLEDGVNLTKYSKALEKVGVSVLDASGELRDMDDILNDLGEKWQDLSKAQQTALAQTVGGVRQYTTLIALMDNFDFYKENLQIAQTSEGTVARQAEIYASSWEGASKRVQAAAQAIYSDLIDDKAFINILNGFEKILTFLDRFIDGIGGLKGLLTGLGTIATTVFQKQFTQGIYNAGVKLKEFFTPQSAHLAAREKFLSDAAERAINYETSSGYQIKTRQNLFRSQLDNESAFIARSAMMTPFQQDLGRMYLDAQRQARDNYEKAAQATEKASDIRGDAQATLFTRLRPVERAPLSESERKDVLNSINNFTGPRSQAQINRLWNGGYYQDPKTGQWTYNPQMGQFKGAQARIDQPLQNLDKFNRGLVEGGLTEDNIGKKVGELFDKSFGTDANKNPLAKPEVKERVMGALNEATGTGLENQIKAAQAAMKAEVNAQLDQEVQAMADRHPEWSQEQIENYRQTRSAEFDAKFKEWQAKTQAEQSGKNAKAFIDNAQAGKNVAEVFSKMATGAMAIAGMSSSLDGMTSSLQGLADGSVDAGQGVTQLISGLSQFGMMAGMAFKSLGLVGGIIVTVVSALLSIAKQTGLIDKALNALSPNRAAKQAADQAKEVNDQAQQTAQSTRQEQTTLKDNLSSLDELNAAMKNLTKGTLQYLNTLDEINAILDDQIEKNKWLQDDTTHQYIDVDPVTGGRYLTAEGKSRLEQEAERRADLAEKRAAVANLQTKITETKKAETVQENLSGDNGGLARVNEIGVGNIILASQFLPTSPYPGGFVSPQATQWGTAQAEAMIADVVTEKWEQADETIVKNISSERAAFERAFNLIAATNEEKDVNERGVTTREVTDREQIATNILVGDYYTLDENGAVINNRNLPWQITQEQLEKYGDKFGYNKNDLGDDNALVTKYVSDRVLANLGKTREELTLEDIANLGEQAQDIGSLHGAKLVKAFEEATGEIFTDQSELYMQESIKNQQRSNLLEKQYNEKIAQIKALEKQAEDNKDTNMLTLINASDNSLKQISKAINNYDSSRYADNEEAAKIAEELYNAQNAQYINLRDSYSSLFKTDKELGSQLFSRLENSSVTMSEAKILKNAITEAQNLFDTEDNENFSKALAEKLFDKDVLNKTLLDSLGQIDWSNSLSALADLKMLSKQAIQLGFGNLSQDYLDLFNQAKESLGGDKGLLQELFGSADFQDSLKSLQKEFKKTGKLSSKDIMDVAESCNSLNNYLEYGDQSASALAAAIEVMSLGSISSIDQISGAFLAAVGAAGALEDQLQQTFKFIDSFTQDRSIQDIPDFFADIAQDLFKELGNGNYGGERMYQDAAAIWGEGYANALREFFIDQQREGIFDLDPSILQQNYQEAFGKYDEVLQSVIKSGNMRPFWDFLLGGEADEYIRSRTGERVSQALKDIGFSNDKANGDIEIDTLGRTTEELTQQIAEALDTTSEEAGVLLQELVGKSAALRQELKINDARKSLENLNSNELEKMSWAEKAVLAQRYKNVLEDVNTEQSNALKLVQQQIEEQKKVTAEALKTGKDMSQIYGDMIKEHPEYSGKDKDSKITDLKTAIELADTLGFTQSNVVDSINDQIKNGNTNLSDFAYQITDAYGQVHNALVTTEDGLIDIEATLNNSKQILQDAQIQHNAEIYASTFLETFKDNKIEIIVEAIDNVSSAIDAIVAANSAKTITISTAIAGNSEASGGIISSNTSGQKNSPGVSLTGEEGTEIIWNKEKGYSYLVGERHPEFVTLYPGDKVFNAQETKQILGSSANGRDIYESNSGPTYSRVAVYGPGVGPNVKSSAIASNVKNSKWEPERYHLITRQLKDLQREYDRLSKIKDNAYGTNKLEAIQREIDATNELIKGQKELVKEAENYLAIDVEHLKSLLAPGEFQIDENGNLLNFEELQQKYRKAAEQDKDEKAQDVWKALNQYEETLDKMQEANAEMQDLLYQEMELRLEKITTKVEMRIDFDDREIKTLDFYIQRIDDNIYHTAEVLTLTEQKLGLINRKLEDTRIGIEGIFSELSDSEGNKITKADGTNYTLEDWLALSAEERDMLDINDNFGKQLEEYMDDLLEYIEELEEFKTKGVEEFGEAFSELNDNVRTSIDLFDHYNQLLSSLKNITDLQGIKMTAEMKAARKEIDAIMYQNTQRNIQAEGDNYKRLIGEVEDLRKKIANTSDETLKRAWEEQLKVAEDELRTSGQNMLSLWETGLQQAKNMFEQALQDAVDAYEEDIAGMYGTTDELQKAWDQQKKNDEFYVKDYERYYQISKLQRSITKDLDAAARSGNKQNQGLKKLYDELNAARENGVQLSAYDLDIYAKRYEYEKALMELEDARNNKSEVRLQRDANGNWGYVYTSAADEDDLIAKQQEVDDKFYELQKATQERVASISDEMMQEISGVGARLQELRSTGASQETIDKYLEQEQLYLDNYRKGLAKALADAGMTEEEARARYGNTGFDILNDFQETLFSAITGGDEGLDEFFDRVLGSIHAADGQMSQATRDYQTSMDGINKFFNESGEDLAKVIKGFASVIGEESEGSLLDNEKQIKDAKDTFDEILGVARDFEREFMTTYQPVINYWLGIYEKMLDALRDLNREEFEGPGHSSGSSIKEKVDQFTNNSGGSGGESPGGGGSSGSGGSSHGREGPDVETPSLSETPSPGKATPKVFSHYVYKYLSGNTHQVIAVYTDKTKANAWVEQCNQKDDLGLEGDYKKFGCSKCKHVYSKEYIYTAAPPAPFASWDAYISYNPRGTKPPKKPGFDTGGYTGSWGSEGRMAILHEKEIVLNKNDTKNFLDATNILRTIDLQTNLFSRGLGNSLIPWIDDMKQGTLDQNVHIEASFPNVQNHDEIEMAFDNLINKASQYANRKNMSSMTFQDMYTTKF